jgi:hypothetical protein
MNQNILNPNFEKNTEFSPKTFPSKFRFPKSIYCYFLPLGILISGHQRPGKVKLHVVDNTVEDSVYQHLSITEPCYFLNPIPNIKYQH